MNSNSCSGCNLIGLSSSLAILIGEQFNSTELGILSGFFSALGDNLAILASSNRVEDNT